MYSSHDFTISEFGEMEMQPSMERALRYKEIKKAGGDR
jgi:hypothetical protein